MSRRYSNDDRGAARHSRRPVVLVFGEGTRAAGSQGNNDAKALKHLLRFVNSELARTCDIKAMKRPVSLTRTARDNAVRSWLSDVEKVARGELARVIAIVIHRDADGPDPAGAQYHALTRDLAKYLREFTSIPVIPVQMTEAWWFLFPDAVRAIAPGAWRDLRFPGGDVEVISDPKGRLIALTGKTTRTYRESDSEQIAQSICAQAKGPVGTSRSWERFVADAQRLG